MTKIKSLFIVFFLSVHVAYSAPMKLISYNVLYGFNHGKAVKMGSQWLKEQNADMIALQEVKGFDTQSFSKLAKTWGHDFSYFYKRQPGLPLAFSSKQPISEVAELDEGVKRGFLLLKSGGVYFVVVHMTSQRLSARQTETAYISSTIKRLLKDKKPLVVLGDFNAMSSLDQGHLLKQKVLLKQMRENPKKRQNLNNNEFDTSILKVFYELGLRDTCYEKLQGSVSLEGSFPSMLLEKISTKDIQKKAFQRIDFILTSSDLAERAKRADIPKDGILDKISDHYPVIAEFD